MLCFRYRKLLMPYSEGVLGADVAAKVKRHAASCPRCAAELEMIRTVTRALGSADVPVKEPADDLWARVSARIANEPVRRAPTPKLGIAAGVAAAVLVGLIGMKLLMPGAARVVAPEPVGVKEMARTTPLIASKPRPAVELKSQPRLQPPASKPVEIASLPVGRPAFSGKPDNRVYADTGAGAEPDLRAAERGTPPAAVPLASTPAAEVYRAAKDVAPTPAGSASDARAGEGNLHVESEAAAPTASTLGANGRHYPAAPNSAYYCNDTTKAASTVSIVDELSETEGIRTAAIFSY